MIKFEKVSRFKEIEFDMPSRKTVNSAGYDFVVAEDIVIPTWTNQLIKMTKPIMDIPVEGYTLEEIAKMTKMAQAKPTLVSTGVKCYLPKGYYLELSVRSSTPLKYWLILANGIGIIDGDYVDNKDNEGEIFFQLINLSPYPIALKKGDIIGQGIIKRYYSTDDDELTARGAVRTGGFGSTSAARPACVGLRHKANVVDDAMREDIKKQILYGDNSIPTINLSQEIEQSNLKNALDGLHKAMYEQLKMSAT